jgi:hypothetical protein
VSGDASAAFCDRVAGIVVVVVMERRSRVLVVVVVREGESCVVNGVAQGCGRIRGDARGGTCIGLLIIIYVRFYCYLKRGWLGRLYSNLRKERPYAEKHGPANCRS